MNTTAKEKQRLLIVDDSKLVRVTARKILSDHFETVEAVDGEEAWNRLEGKELYSLVISDLSMPKLDGFDLLERIRNSHIPHIRDLPVIVITGSNDSEETKERATQAGATDFIGKPFDAVHLLARAQAHASAHAAARKLRDESFALEENSCIDPQTGLANEPAFMNLGYQQLAYAVRHNTRLSVFQIEIDHYGELFRSHGEGVGESILKTVATALSGSIRDEDTAARIGTARFALLLPGLNNNGIQNLAERIMKNVSERVLKHGETRTHFTVSIGIAAAEICRDSRFDDLLSLANANLSHALESGGNRFVLDRTRQGSTATGRRPGTAAPPPGRTVPADILEARPGTDGIEVQPAVAPAAEKFDFAAAIQNAGSVEETIEITADVNTFTAQPGTTAAPAASTAPKHPGVKRRSEAPAAVVRSTTRTGNTGRSRAPRKGVLYRLLGGIGSLFK